MGLTNSYGRHAYLAGDLGTPRLLGLLGADQGKSDRQDQEKGQKEGFEVHGCSRNPNNGLERAMRREGGSSSIEASLQVRGMRRCQDQITPDGGKRV